MESTRLLQRMRGFTLIEIAIVLVVIGLLLSGGLLAVAPVLERTKITQTENSLDIIEESLVLYAIQNGCLPCPADGALAEGDANAGLSLDSGDATYGVCAPTTSCRTPDGTDIVPYRTLGLSRAQAIDGFGNLISFQLSDAAVTGAAAGTNDLDVNLARSGTTYDAGLLTVDDETAGAPEVTTAAAYVLVSHGSDNSGACCDATGAIKTDPRGSANQGHNSDGDENFVQMDPIDIEDNTYFDDIVRWKTAPRIIQECGPSTTGTCGNP